MLKLLLKLLMGLPLPLQAQLLQTRWVRLCAPMLLAQPRMLPMLTGGTAFRSVPCSPGVFGSLLLSLVGPEHSHPNWLQPCAQHARRPDARVY